MLLFLNVSTCFWFSTFYPPHPPSPPAHCPPTPPPPSVADLPGLVEGAHENRGLGHDFLRHIERTSLLCFVLDLAAEEPPVQQLSALQRELELYQPGLSQRPCLIAANKSDLPGGKERLRALRIAVDAKRNQGELPGLKTLLEGDPSVRAISAKTSSNLEPLVLQMYRMLQDVTVADRARKDALRAEATRAAEAEVEAEEERWKQQNPMAAFRARKRAMEEMEQGGGDGESEEYQFEYDEYE